MHCPFDHASPLETSNPTHIARRLLPGALPPTHPKFPGKCVSALTAPGVVGDTWAMPGLVKASLRLVHDVGIRTQDVHGVGPVPAKPGEVPATIILYPSGD